MADSPQHVAIIMDGNGRWARSRGLPRVAGHRASVKVVRRIVEECAQRKVRYLTLFAFSSENWRRPPDEVGMLMGLFLDALVREVADLHRNQVRLRFIGDRELLGAELEQRMQDARSADRGEFRTGAAWWRWPTADAGISPRPADRWPRMSPPASWRAADIDEEQVARASGAGRNSGSGPADPHRRRAAHQQFLAVESRLHRTVFLRGAVAGILAGASAGGLRVFRASASAASARPRRSSRRKPMLRSRDA